MLERFKKFFLEQLRQGTTPRALALTCAVGAVIALFPVLGATTVLCLIFGAILKLNQPVLQTVNYAMAPLQLLMIPVFLKAGAWICRVPAVSVNPQKIVTEFWESPGKFVTDYGWAGLQAILAWALLAPVVLLIVNFLVLLAIKRIQRARGGA